MWIRWIRIRIRIRIRNTASKGKERARKWGGNQVDIYAQLDMESNRGAASDGWW